MSFSKSTWGHRIAQISPRREPVIMASHTCVPQSGTLCQAWLRMVAASSAVGDCGFAGDGAGGSVWFIGLIVTQPQYLYAILCHNPCHNDLPLEDP